MQDFLNRKIDVGNARKQRSFSAAEVVAVKSDVEVACFDCGLVGCDVAEDQLDVHLGD